MRVAHTRAGRRAVESVLHDDPELAVVPIATRRLRDAGLARVDRWPERLDGFEDLARLFSSDPLNWGVITLTFEEAAYLFRAAREAGRWLVVEIGRFRGGSTLLLAAAAPNAEVWSYDIAVPEREEYDAPLRETLVRFGFERRVRLLTEDSSAAALPPEPCDLVFVDGDHSTHGVLADARHWLPALRDGGRMVFHDADAPTVSAALAEIDGWPELRRAGGAQSLVEFVRA
jgi:predicted O-methyltransferase YrrM